MAMDEAAEGTKATQELWDRDVLEQGGDRRKRLGQEFPPIPWAGTESPKPDGSLSLPAFLQKPEKVPDMCMGSTRSPWVCLPSLKGSEVGVLGLLYIHHQPKAMTRAQ